ncbi:MAG TPA: GNAT family N-acetyltransferase [Nocardioides sp.]|nr:GNAT family N-acetyltransferase [Nocardioides sp.]
MTEPVTGEMLLMHFHTQIRLADSDAAPGYVVDRDGPVHRTYPPDAAEQGAMVEAPEGLGDDPDHWIGRQVAFFGGRGQVVEWKTYGYDEPADLPERLTRAGFTAQDPEVVLIGRCADLVHDVALPEGTRLREITSDEDWERVRASVDRVWGEDTSWVNDALRAEQRRDPDLLIAAVVEDAASLEVLSYGVLRLQPGTDFCGLWGGSTLPQWRGRGLYRALTSHRARRARDLGYPLARVDTSPDSRPILIGLGMHAVADTRPYLLDPAGGAGEASSASPGTTD